MVFTISVKYLSFKQDLSNIMLMLSDQKATYAILKYAYDVPVDIYEWVLEELTENKDAIIYGKLLKLVEGYVPRYNFDFEELDQLCEFSN